MMRSMYSAVSGLKTHQTRMDVIGNNIANVNTVGFKSSNVIFQDLLYQNLSGASGANATTGVGGVNAKQIGLGVNTASTNINITGAGAAETTGLPFDIRLTDASTTHFFIVNNGSQNLFTRSGSFYVDGAGNLAMTSTGYTVMGWQVDPETGQIRKDTVSELQIMKTENMTSPPEETTMGKFGGIIDKNDPDVLSDEGLIKNLNFYDKLGYQYTARFAVKSTPGVEGEFRVILVDVIDNNSNSIMDKLSDAQKNALFGQTQTNITLATYTDVKKGFYKDPATGQIYIGTNNQGEELQWNNNQFVGATSGKTYSMREVFGVGATYSEAVTNGTNNTTANYANGTLTITGDETSYTLKFSTMDGTFVGIGTGSGATFNGSDAVNLNLSSAVGAPVGGGGAAAAFPDGNFSDISIDFSTLQNADNGGKTTATLSAGGGPKGEDGKGRKLGALIGLSVDNNGKIYGSYDNGNSELLGQIAVAQFANASGLEKAGENCYTTTLNSGDFDGIGVEIQADGSKMTSGELEMSNVDLSTEFTYMITTQRGFQANSRVITTSDSLLEELVNLKR